jgi:hypothetical protein
MWCKGARQGLLGPHSLGRRLRGPLLLLLVLLWRLRMVRIRLSGSRWLSSF